MSNVPDVVRDEPTRELARTDTDSWVEIMRPVIALADRICDTEFVPKGLRGSAPATAAAMLYGREVGLPPMTALNVTHVIEGKPGIEAEAMRAMVYAAGHEIEFVESTGAICTMRGRRTGQENWTTLSWTIDMARAAGLLGKSNWKGYPRAMLQARCSAELCRMIFPDVIHGFRTVEELDDLDTEPATDAPAGPTTKVTRTGKKAAAKKSTPAPLEQRERPAIAGPPLPGEDGYDEGSGVNAGQVLPPRGADEAPDEAKGRGAATPDPAPLPLDDTGTDHEPGAGVTEGPGGGADEGSNAPPPGSEVGGKKDRGPRKATRAQHRMIFALLDPLEVTSDQDRYDVASAITYRKVESFNDLTHDNASAIIETLGRLKSREELDALLAELSRKNADRWSEGDRS